jgi:hypothetical protein
MRYYEPMFELGAKQRMPERTVKRSGESISEKPRKQLTNINGQQRMGTRRRRRPSVIFTDYCERGRRESSRWRASRRVQTKVREIEKADEDERLKLLENFGLVLLGLIIAPFTIFGTVLKGVEMLLKGIRKVMTGDTF